MRRSFVLLGFFLMLLPLACGGGSADSPADLPRPSHTVTFQAGLHGSLAGTLVQTVPYGGSCTPVTAVADNLYAFVDWRGAGFTTTSANPPTLDNVTADLTITAGIIGNTRIASIGGVLDQSRFSADITVNLNNPGAGVIANIGRAAADFR